jgi:hypothetical protein
MPKLRRPHDPVLPDQILDLISNRLPTDRACDQ